MKSKLKAQRTVFIIESFFFILTESKCGENGVRHVRASSSSLGNTLTNKERKHMETGVQRHANFFFILG